MVDTSPGSWHGLDMATVGRSRTRRWSWARHQKKCHQFEKGHGGKKFKQLWCATGSHEYSRGFPGDLRLGLSSGLAWWSFDSRR